MNRTLLRFEEKRGYHPPSASFVKRRTTKRGTRMVFNVACLARFGLGARYRSADLFWSPNTNEIIMQVYESPDQGTRRFSIVHPHGYSWVTLSCTRFLQEFNISFRYHCRYPVAFDNECIYIDLSSYENIKRSEVCSGDRVQP